jgi:predicted molibdopterin-dependent oxidoreductase YjgC
MARRGDVWLKPAPGTTATVLNGIARKIVDLGLAAPGLEQNPSFGQWKASLENFDSARVSQATGISEDQLASAAILYSTGGAGISSERPEIGYPPSLIYQTVAHQGAEGTIAFNGSNRITTNDGDPAEIATICNNLAILTGNFGRAGGGVASLRGPANYQGTTDMGAHPSQFPGGGDVEDATIRAKFERAWLTRWAERAKTTNGFLPVQELPSKRGLSGGELAAAINRGQVKGLFIDGSIAGRFNDVDPELTQALSKLEFLIVSDYFPSSIAQVADVVLPKATALEKDGTFTSFDRTIQRVRAAVPAMGEAKSIVDTISIICQRMGYGLDNPQPAQVMNEIAYLVPAYGGVSYARLERGALSTPVVSFIDQGSPILAADGDGFVRLNPSLIASAS